MDTDIYVFADGTLRLGDKSFPCALGKTGITLSKQEGDGATPAGEFSLRGLYYRPGRLEMPRTRLSVTALIPQMGWCDDPRHVLYNQPVALPFGASHEVLWRDDDRYDILIPIGYNDGPIRPGLGSAIFFHLATSERWYTEGCVALHKKDMLPLLPLLGPDSRMIIAGPSTEQSGA
jgi:L,D-peptidoglycan transpeptidase YkuD (ErfK/YbiS/YcfS/YnhG family)